VYKTNPHTLEEIRYDIRSEISVIPGDFQRVNKVFRSCTECIRPRGQHFQHLL